MSLTCLWLSVEPGRYACRVVEEGAAQQPWWRRAALALGKRMRRPFAPLLAGASTLLGTLVGFNAVLLFPTGILLLAAGVAGYSRDAWLREEESQRVKAAKSHQTQLEAAATADLERLAADHSQFADVFAELVRNAADMADKGKADRAADFGRLVKHAVSAIAWVLHADVAGVRAVVYQVSEDERRMEVVDWAAGIHRAAPRPFIRGTDRGDKAFATLEAGTSLFVDDISKAPEDWAGSGDGYNTFITTPITSATVGFGLLTVDAPETDSLTEDDENDLRLVAGILAMIFAEKQRGPRGRGAGSPA